MSARTAIALSAVALSAVALVPGALAHGNHDANSITEGQTVSEDPIDLILWLHIFIQMFAYGVILPIGMIFGMAKSSWHVPTQIVGSSLAVVGFFLGHAHRGRQFVGGNIHGSFAHILQIMLVVQVVLGLYLKGHWERGINGWIRRAIRPCHSVIGKAMPVFSWAQMVFGGITALGFCQGEHVGQCAAHFIMGSAFVAYGILLTIILLVGQVWMRRTGRSQEFFDSSVIAAWGCVNTFTEHRWGTAWVRNDWQHTTMGIIWWCAGLAGVWMSRDRDGNPKRNFIPGFVLVLTGWAMSSHPQELMVSAATHSMFGYCLMAAGATRIVEISFVLKDRQSLDDDGRTYNSFQFIPVYFLYASGFLFMSATEEQMTMVANSDMDHVAYLLIIFSLAFLVFLFASMLIQMYDRLADPDGADKDASHGVYTGLNGNVPLEEGRARDAEEFELGGLSSDDEGADDAEERKTVRSSDESSSSRPRTNGRANGQGSHV